MENSQSARIVKIYISNVKFEVLLFTLPRLVELSLKLIQVLANKKHALSGRTESEVVWHSEGRAFGSHWLQQVLRFVACNCIVQGELRRYYVARNCIVQVELKGYYTVKSGGNGQSIGSTVTDAIVQSWLWATATGSCPLGYFSSITASSWWLTPQTVVVNSPLGSSWP